jgi:hypothetical protein
VRRQLKEGSKDLLIAMDILFYVAVDVGLLVRDRPIRVFFLVCLMILGMERGLD